jgi:hypothetical protein
MNEYPKAVKRQLRQLAGILHERAVREHLDRLADDFQDWRAGKLDTWELTDRIHRFHDGPSRDLYKQYEYGQPDLLVAHALAHGLLGESEVSPEVRQALAGRIDLFRKWAEESGEGQG